MANATGTELTGREREVVEALCRPLREAGPETAPASNQQIAGEVFLSLDAVKGHLRTIYAKLGLDSLRQNEKRARLAALGLRGELDPPPAPRARRRGRRAALAPALATVLLALLAGLALAGVVPAPMVREEAPDDPPWDATKDGSTDAAPTEKSGAGRRAPRRAEAPDLVDESEVGLLPSAFVPETGNGIPAVTVEEVEVREPKSEAPGKALGRFRRVAQRAKPEPKVASPPPVEQGGAAPAKPCFNHVHRTVTRRVVFVWVPRRVRVRIAHRHVRIERRTVLHRHRRVWVDRRGRRHVREWVHPHETTVRRPYTHWHVRWKRKRVKLRRVERRVQARDHQHCG